MHCGRFSDLSRCSTAFPSSLTVTITESVCCNLAGKHSSVVCPGFSPDSLLTAGHNCPHSTKMRCKISANRVKNQISLSFSEMLPILSNGSEKFLVTSCLDFSYQAKDIARGVTFNTVKLVTTSFIKKTLGL